MKAPPASTKTSLTQCLNAHAHARWPDLAGVEVRFRANFAYIDGRDANGTVLKLCRLRYGGSAHTWGFARYRASHDDYEDTFLPNGMLAGSAEQALDCACGLYLNDPTAWLPDTQTNERAGPRATGPPDRTHPALHATLDGAVIAQHLGCPSA